MNAARLPALRFTFEPLSAIIPVVSTALAQRGEVQFSVPDPDRAVGHYAGEATAEGLYRPLLVWLDLADALGAHLLLPERQSDGQIRLHYRAYARTPEPDEHGYDPEKGWGRVNKLEEPTFLLTLTEALRRVDPPHGGRVLALGLNAGHELDALATALPGRTFEVVGVDLNPAALKRAAQRSPAAKLLQADINLLPPDLGTFDLVLALSVLQSPGVRQDVLLAKLRRQHLTPAGGLILGFPNARYRDGLLSYGARLRNFDRPDLSLMTADVAQARRGLQKHGYKVFVTGKYEVLVTAIPATRPTPKALNWGL